MAVSNFLLVLGFSCVGLTFSVSGIQNEKWHDAGSTLKSVKKLTTGDKLRVQVELLLSPETQVEWIVDQTIIGSNEGTFGTSTTKLDNSVIYTIDLSTPVKYLELKSVSRENVLTRYTINVNSDNSSRYFDDRACQASMSNINSTSFAAYFRCFPELDSRDSWYQSMAVFDRIQTDKVGYSTLQGEPNPYFNLTFERNTIAKGIVVFSDLILEMGKTFMFLDSFLTLNIDDTLNSITYAYLQDISSIKTEKEFEFLNTFPDSEISEGKTVTIFCEALGRSPPSVRMKRNGMTISESDGVYIASRRTNLWSTFYVTFLHASKEIEGNYSCVAESESRTAYQSYRVEVKPIVCWDLMIDFNVTDETSPLVVEGSKGVNVDCSNYENDDVTFDTIKRTALTQWTERLEVTIPRSAFKMRRIDCTATDKNGEISIELY